VTLLFPGHVTALYGFLIDIGTSGGYTLMYYFEGGNLLLIKTIKVHLLQQN